MKNLELYQKLSVLHCVYQLIASADGGINDDRDESAITLVLNELELNSVHSWDSALYLNPHDCFIHIAGLGENDKDSFKKLLNSIAKMAGNKEYREICCQHIFQLCYLT